MQQFRSGARSVAGRVLGLVAAYALVLNVILAGLLGAQSAALASGDAGTAICITAGHDGSGSEAPLPADHADAKIHCLLCTAGGSAVALAAVSVAAFDRVAVSRTILWRASEREAWSSATDLQQLPRGPPLPV